MKRLFLIRHAPIIHDGCYTGWRDVDCVLPNSYQPESLAMLPAHAKWISSDLKRSKQTAHWLMDHVEHADELHLESRLREQHFGDWEGRNYDDVFSETPQIDWEHPATIIPSNGESFIDMCTRVQLYLNGLAEGDYVIVAHAGTIKAALGILPEEALVKQVDTGSLTVVQMPSEIIMLNAPLLLPA